MSIKLTSLRCTAAARGIGTAVFCSVGILSLGPLEEAKCQENVRNSFRKWCCYRDKSHLNYMSGAKGLMLRTVIKMERFCVIWELMAHLA